MAEPALTGKQKSHLRALGHSLEPVVLMGQKGLTAAVMREIDGALTAHELIKVKLPKSDDIDPAALELAIQAELGALCAARIGHLLLLYRPHPKKPRIVLPMATGATKKKRAPAKKK
jgi:RNA-binding protein